jgi:hypothetical protein
MKSKENKRLSSFYSEEIEPINNIRIELHKEEKREGLVQTSKTTR